MSHVLETSCKFSSESLGEYSSKSIPRRVLLEVILGNAWGIFDGLQVKLMPIIKNGVLPEYPYHCQSMESMMDQGRRRAIVAIMVDEGEAQQSGWREGL